MILVRSSKYDLTWYFDDLTWYFDDHKFGILFNLVINGSFIPGGSALQIVHPRILDESGTGGNLTMIPTVTNIGGEKFDIVRYDFPYDQIEWTKVIPP